MLKLYLKADFISLKQKFTGRFTRPVSLRLSFLFDWNRNLGRFGLVRHSGAEKGNEGREKGRNAGLQYRKKKSKNKIYVEPYKTQACIFPVIQRQTPQKILYLYLLNYVYGCSLVTSSLNTTTLHYLQNKLRKTFPKIPGPNFLGFRENIKFYELRGFLQLKINFRFFSFV